TARLPGRSRLWNPITEPPSVNRHRRELEVRRGRQLEDRSGDPPFEQPATGSDAGGSSLDQQPGVTHLAEQVAPDSGRRRIQAQALVDRVREVGVAGVRVEADAERTGLEARLDPGHLVESLERIEHHVL